MADNGITKEELLRLLSENKSVSSILEKNGYYGTDNNGQQIFSTQLENVRAAMGRENDKINDNAKKLKEVSDKLERVIRGLNNARVNPNDYRNLSRDELKDRQLTASTRQEELKYKNLIYYRDLLDEQKAIEEKNLNIAKEYYKYKYQEEQIRESIRKEAEKQRRIEEEGLTLQERINEELDKRGFKTKMITNGWSEIKAGFNEAKTAVKALLEPFAKLDKATMNYARSMGISAKQANELRNAMLHINNSDIEGRLTKLGFTTAEMLEATAKYSAAIGRRVSFNGAQELEYAAMTKFLGEENTQAIAKGLDNFGLDMTEASNRVRDMFVTSEKTGVAFETYSKAYVENLKIANSYTFSNGLRGLDAMAKKSAEIKLNIADVARIADKVSTLEGAMQAGAGLSVLGGSFAMYSNPMQMLYEGLNDMEALGERVEKIFADSVFFDKEKGQLDMSAFDRQRMRAAAQSMGVDYNAMVDMAFARGRRDVVAKQLNAAGMKEGSDGYEKLMNQAFLDKNGKAMINIMGRTYNVADVAKNDQLLDVINRTSDDDSENLSTIAQTLLSVNDILTGIEKNNEEMLANDAVRTGIGDGVKKMMDSLTENTSTLKLFYYSYLASQALQLGMGVTRMANGGVNMGRGLSGGLKSFNYNGKTVTKSGNLLQWTHKGQDYWLNRATGERGMGKAPAWAKGGGFKPFGGFNALTGTLAGVGAIGGFAGGALLGAAADKYANAKDEAGIEKGASLGAWSKAAYGLGIGTSIGSFFGPWGALIGAGVGAAAGGIYGYFSEQEQKYAKLISLRTGRPLRGKYSLDELKEMYESPNRIGPNLNAKIASAEGLPYDASSITEFLTGKTVGYRNGGIVHKFADGGLIHGKGTGTSDSNLAWLSNNEYVMPAAQVAKPNNRVILDSMREGNNLIPRFANGGIFSPIKNSLKSMKVAQKTYSAGGGSSVGEVKVAPINITGTIKLDLNGTTKDIDANKLLNNTMFTKQLTDVIARNLNKQLNYGYDKNTFYKKF